MTTQYDVAIAGGGPAGAACATLCAAAGLRTLVLEKSIFPRDKVCGDCLNPGCWPIFEQLGVAGRVLAAPHASLGQVEFLCGRALRLSAPLDGNEIAIPRRILDDILLRRSQEAGAEVRQGAPLQAISRNAVGDWRLEAGNRSFTARLLVAADGRNSTVARLLGAAPPACRDRIALQTHIPAHVPAGEARSIEMHLLPEGYCGVAPVGDSLINICLVASSDRLDGLKAAISSRFSILDSQPWRAIAPLRRAPIGPYRDGVLYVGDAARVVEPFTGEGIYYALRSGVLAARQILAGALREYPAAHAALYRRRLWVNGLARFAVTHPRAGAGLLRLMSAHRAPLEYLVRRVTAPLPALGV